MNFCCMLFSYASMASIFMFLYPTAFSSDRRRCFSSAMFFAVTYSTKYPGIGKNVIDAVQESGDSPLSVLRLALTRTTEEKADEIYRKKLRNSKLGTPVFLSDLYTYKVRQLDLEYISQLGELSFIRDKMNLVIWGPPVTGKTWMAKALATKACQKGFSTRWIT